MRPRFTLWFAGLNSPETYSMFVQALCLLVGVVVFWILFAIILSSLGGPLFILLTLGLVTTYFVREFQIRRREQWINEGRCGQCGYDLRATPDRCPECGREAALDEPAWRKMRREREMRLKQATGELPTAEQNRQRLLSPLPPEPEDGGA
jgi:hypothetical protein